MLAATDNETILITGASSGIGLGVAEAYVKRGANVVLNARNAARLAAQQTSDTRTRLPSSLGILDDRRQGST